MSVSAGNYGGKLGQHPFPFKENIKMKPLVLKCKIKDKQRLDMSWLSRIDTTNLSDIKNLVLVTGVKYTKYLSYLMYLEVTTKILLLRIQIRD